MLAALVTIFSQKQFCNQCCCFGIDATYEMRTTEYSEICISIDTHIVAERAYKGNGKVGKESKVA
jgi:hypothetical protein